MSHEDELSERTVLAQACVRLRLAESVLRDAISDLRALSATREEALAVRALVGTQAAYEAAVDIVMPAGDQDDYKDFLSMPDE